MFSDERRMQFLQERVQQRLKTCQLESFYSYTCCLRRRRAGTSYPRFLEPQHDRNQFFRSVRSSKFSRSKIFEHLLNGKEAARDYTLRILSAGCSTGQEPYTLAMLICDALAFAGCAAHRWRKNRSAALIPAPWNVKVSLRTSISRHCSPRGKEAHQAMEKWSIILSRLRYFDKARVTAMW